MEIVLPTLIGAAIIIFGALYGVYAKNGCYLVNELDPLPYVALVVVIGIGIAIGSYFAVVKLFM